MKRRFLWVVAVLACVVVTVTRTGKESGGRGPGGGMKQEAVTAGAAEGSAGETGAEDGFEPGMTARLEAEKLEMKARLGPGRAGAKEQPVTAGRQWRMRLGEREVVMEVALDELWAGGGLRAIPAQPDLEGLLGEARKWQAETGKRARLVLYPRGVRQRSELNRRLLSDTVVLEWDGGEGTRRKLEAAGVRELRQPEYGGGLWVGRVEGGLDAPLRALEALREQPGLARVEPQLARQQQKKVAAPNDPLFAAQWHLKNTGQGGGKAGVDARVEGVWERFQGGGVEIGVIDDGVELEHPDLVENRAAEGHYDWNGEDADPAPDPELNDDHGTAVAGVAAARGGNGRGVSGAAPRASLVGLRLISEPSTDVMEAEALTHRNGEIGIKNNSWGPADDASVLGTIGVLTKAAMEAAAVSGRGGKGVLLTWAGGNGRRGSDQSNKDAYANNRHVLAVGAVTNAGAQAGYSESGANLVVSAPSSGGTRGIVTTDLTGAGGYNRGGVRGETSDADYTQSFGGTSSATPLVSGVAALMLEANPDLGYRDVKEIFLRSSSRLAPASKEWVTQKGGRPDLPPIQHHPGFGGGMIQAEAAVAMAEGWRGLGEAASQEVSRTPNQPVPDGTGVVAQEFEFGAGPALRVETVEVTVSLEHGYRGDLEIELVSPRGVRSRLVSASAEDYGYDPELDDFGAGYEAWTFTSVRHWGESSAGVWRVEVRDRVRADSGFWESATVRIHGTEEGVPRLTQVGAGRIVAEGGDVELTAEADEERAAFEWRRGGARVGGTLEGRFRLPQIGMGQAGNYTVAAMTAVGEAESGPVPVTVVRVEDSAVVVLEGRPLRLGAQAAGPSPLSYEWRLDGRPLVEGVDGTGTRSETLVVARSGAAHAGVFECLVSDGERMLGAGERQVTVILRPVVPDQTLGNTVVSGQPIYGLAALHGPTRFLVTGLPPGMRFNAQTGELSGRPTRAGTYTLRVSGVNAAGTGAARELRLVVEELPAGTVNVFRGVVEAAEINQGLGGAVELVVGGTGAYTGRLVLGGRAQRFRGVLSAEPGGVKPKGEARIRRRGQADMVVNFEIDPAAATVAGTARVDAVVAAWSGQSSGWNARSQPATSRAGYYTAGLGNGGGVVAGKGFMAVTVTAGGAVRMTGRTGEARPFTAATILSRTGEAALFALTDSTRSSLRGWVTVAPGTTAPGYLEAAVSGALAWRRLAQPPGTRLYPEGFTGMLTAAGRRHVKPAPGGLLMNLAAPVSATDRNAMARFGGPVVQAAQMAAALAATSFTLTDGHRAFFGAARSAENAAAVRLVVNPETGLVGGSFAVSDALAGGGAPLVREVTFYGLALEGGAEGCMVMAELPVPPQRAGETMLVSGWFSITVP